MRRGSPLPIPNRVVKPACADGTAFLWESMSSPFFENPVSNETGFFVLYTFIKKNENILNPCHLFDEVFFVLDGMDAD